MKNVLGMGILGLTATTLAVFGGACGAGTGPGATTATPPPPDPVVQLVAVKTTTANLPPGDPGIITTLADLMETYVTPTAQKPYNKLVVFMPGSLAQACHYQQVLHEAAVIGYYAVGLSYPNGATPPLFPGGCPVIVPTQRTLTEICGNHIQGFDCYAELRRNRFDGKKEDHGIAPPAGQPCPRPQPPCDPVAYPKGCFCDDYQIQSASEGIENRLYQLLVYLGHCDGTQDTGWCSFVDTTKKKPRWGKMVLAGHSQGGGEAAYIAKLHTVLGVVMFSSPEDAAVQDPTINCITHPTDAGCLVTGSAEWLNNDAGFKTPLARFYSLTHEEDEVVPRVEAALNTLANSDGTHLTGSSCVDAAKGPATPGASIHYAAQKSDAAPCYAATAAAGAPPPYGHAQRLYTNLHVESAIDLSKYHDSTVVDLVTPKCPSDAGRPALAPAWRQMLWQAGGVENKVAPAPCE